MRMPLIGQMRWTLSNSVLGSEEPKLLFSFLFIKLFRFEL